MYPAEVYSDDAITETGIIPQAGNPVSFLRGWNFVTDLYRILEHMNERLTPAHIRKNDSKVALDCLWKPAKTENDCQTVDNVLAMVQRLYEDTLPDEFKCARPMTGDIWKDRYGFQG